jgi:transposase
VGHPVRFVAIQEAGLDGSWLRRWLVARGIESDVVDAASIAAPRRRRRAKRDGIDGETLSRVLAAFLRGIFHRQSTGQRWARSHECSVRAA